MGGGYVVCAIHIHGTRANRVKVYVLGGWGEKLNDLVSEQPGIRSKWKPPCAFRAHLRCKNLWNTWLTKNTKTSTHSNLDANQKKKFKRFLHRGKPYQHKSVPMVIYRKKYQTVTVKNVPSSSLGCSLRYWILKRKASIINATMMVITIWLKREFKISKSIGQFLKRRTVQYSHSPW